MKQNQVQLGLNRFFTFIIKMINKLFPKTKESIQYISDSSHPRQQVIPNCILIADHSVYDHSYQRKKKKLPFFMLNKSQKSQNNQTQSNIFTSRGIISSVDPPLLVSRSPRKSNHIIRLNSQESKLTHFNRLILTPYNFTRFKTKKTRSLSQSINADQKIDSKSIDGRSSQSQSSHRPYSSGKPFIRRATSNWSQRQQTICAKRKQDYFTAWQTKPIDEQYC